MVQTAYNLVPSSRADIKVVDRHLLVYLTAPPRFQLLCEETLKVQYPFNIELLILSFSLLLDLNVETSIHHLSRFVEGKRQIVLAAVFAGTMVQ